MWQSSTTNRSVLLHRLVHKLWDTSFDGWHGFCFVLASARSSARNGGLAMLHWAAVFFVIALLAAIFGFGGLAASAAGVAKILFLVFLVLAVISLIFGRRVST